MLRYLHTLFFNKLWNYQFPTPIPLLNETLVAQETNPQLKLAHQTALKLLDLIYALFAVKLPRDGFANKRKAHALKILGVLWEFYKTEKGVDICIEGLKNKKEDVVITAVNVLGDYYSLHDIKPPQAVLDLIDKQLEKSKYVYAVYACANFLVTTKLLNKYNADNRVRDWKRRNDYPMF